MKYFSFSSWQDLASVYKEEKKKDVPYDLYSTHYWMFFQVNFKKLKTKSLLTLLHSFRLWSNQSTHFTEYVHEYIPNINDELEVKVYEQVQWIKRWYTAIKKELSTREHIGKKVHKGKKDRRIRCVRR